MERQFPIFNNDNNRDGMKGGQTGIILVIRREEDLKGDKKKGKNYIKLFDS